MPILTLKNEPGIAFRFGVDVPFETHKEKFEWKLIVTRFLHFAFAFRAASLITLSPMQWSIGSSLPAPRYFRNGKTEYLINHIEQCLPEMLDEIADSEDFRRGLLWVMEAYTGEEESVAAIMEEMILALGFPTASYELLMLSDDFRWAHWLSPGKDSTEVELEIKKLVLDFRWQIRYDHKPDENQE